MKNFDFASLQEEIEQAFKQAVREVRDRNIEEEFCAYALYSDDSGMTVCPAMNTRSHLAEAQGSDPSDSSYYKFSPGEWRFEAQGADEAFSRICSRLREEHRRNSQDREWYGWFRGRLFETCVNALQSLRSKGFFASYCKTNCLLMFAVSDSSLGLDVEAKWVARLNCESVADEFTRWLSSQEP